MYFHVLFAVASNIVLLFQHGGHGASRGVERIPRAPYAVCAPHTAALLVVAACITRSSMCYKMQHDYKVQHVL